MLWAEKYRPDRLDLVIGQDNLVETLKGCLNIPIEDIPHFSLWSSQGLGKSTIVRSFLKDLYGNDYISHVKWLNSSKDRGIETVRTEMTNFAKRKRLGGKRLCIVLDEVDNMTKDAQQALRGTMEKLAKNCLFILTGNYPNKVIPPIISRAPELPIYPFEKEHFRQMCDRIVISEGITIEADALEHLISLNSKDMRKFVTWLQLCAITNKNITKQLVETTIGNIEPDDLNNFIELLFAGSDFETLLEELRKIIYKSGLASRVVITKLFDFILTKEMDETIKINLLSGLRDVDISIANGGTDEIQLSMFLLKFMDSFQI